jgi:riboflavin synthase
MFNGIIKNIGFVKRILLKKNNCDIEIVTKMKFAKKEIGSSISCSGTCLTLESFRKDTIKFYISKETINKTNFKYLKNGSMINLEKSMKYGDRISGHFVQGHIDTTAHVKNIEIVGKSWLVTFDLQKMFKEFLISKGSIAINGVSLTISKITKIGFQISVIPKTLELTNLFLIKKKDVVNIEFDVMGKYIKSFL